ncbi:hypothetical protein CGRA01v4_14819 [Colletotrichum graminicola]|nr:hypothetical protein CGRA01v4_14819 [Colletotrichum graminicola]
MQTDNPCQSRWVGCHALPQGIQSSISTPAPSPRTPRYWLSNRHLLVRRRPSIIPNLFRFPNSPPPTQPHRTSSKSRHFFRPHKPAIAECTSGKQLCHAVTFDYHGRLSFDRSAPGQDHDTPCVIALIRNTSTTEQPRNQKAWRCKPLLVVARQLSWLFIYFFIFSPCVTGRASR